MVQWKPASAHGSNHLSVLVQQPSGQWEALVIPKPYSSIKRSTRLRRIGPELLATSLSVSAAPLYLSSCFYLKNNISRCIASALDVVPVWFIRMRMLSLGMPRCQPISSSQLLMWFCVFHFRRHQQLDKNCSLVVSEVQPPDPKGEI